jgi:acetyl esterase/lipase
MSLFLVAFCGMSADAQELLPLWPEGEMPNTRGLSVQDSVSNDRFYRVGTPGLYAFFPSDEENVGSAVVICPSGGYDHLTYILGGTQLAKWFNTLGMSAFVLKYRLPNSPDLQNRAVGPLQDAQRAMRLVRARADEWGIDPDRVGVFGSSSGGHLASTLATHPDDVSALGDSLDRASYAPDFLMLVSSVITMGEHTHEGSRDNLLGENPSPEEVEAYSNETRVTAETPPTFLVHAANDTAVAPRNSLAFYRALLAHDVPAGLHVFPRGGHAIALRGNPGTTEQWTALGEGWLDAQGLLTSSPQASR